MRPVDQWYNEIRHIIGNGWIALFRGKSLLSRTIQKCDKAYFNHIGVVVKCNGRLLIVDSNAKGVHPDFLSYRISEYEDICFIQPLLGQGIMDFGVEQAMIQAESGIKYDFLLLPQIAAKRFLGMNIKMKDNAKRDICSEFARRYTVEIGSETYTQDILGIEEITPQDFIRYIDSNYILHKRT